MINRALIIYILLFYNFGIGSALGQTDKLIGKNVCLFYPTNFDSKSQLPSFTLLQEPKATDAVPGNWKLNPHFYFQNGKCIATLSVTKGTSLYGTGENTGSLIRNGKTVTLWNTDNYITLLTS